MHFNFKIIFVVSVIVNVVMGFALFNLNTKLKYADRDYIELQSDYYSLNETCGQIREKYYDAAGKSK